MCECFPIHFECGEAGAVHPSTATRPPAHTPLPVPAPALHIHAPTGGASTPAMPQMPPPPGSPATKHVQHEWAAGGEETQRPSRKSYTLTHINNPRTLCQRGREMHEELKWFASFPEELKKFRGKHIAIIGTEVVASGDNAIAILKDAKKRFPAKNPVLAFVPKEDTLILQVI